MERIILKGVTNVPGDSACGEGELAAAIGCVPEHGALAPVWPYRAAAKLPADVTLMCVHEMDDDVRYVFADDEGLYWAAAPAGEAISRYDAKRISSLRCRLAAVAGRRLVFVDAEGLHIAIADVDGYRVQGPRAPMPVIEFGMVRAGYVSMPQSVEVPSSMCRAEAGGVAGSGAWTVHAPSATQAADHESAAKSVHAALMQAIDRQVSARGYFHQPFMVRYGVRLTDGSYAAVSPPVVMLPSALPPCFAVASSVGSDDKSIVTLSSTSAHYCRLQYRVVRGLSAELAGAVAAIDIFCSPQMLTYREDASGNDGVVCYATMNSGPALRGSTDDSSDVLAGHWADDGVECVDHYLADMPWRESRCWQLMPDASWVTRLLSNDKFCRVASIPAADLTESESFVGLAVCNTGAKSLAAQPLLPRDAAGSRTLMPDAMMVQGERLIVAGARMSIADPWPLRAMMAYAKGASADIVRVTVMIKSGDRDVSTEVECTGLAGTARYLYTDIPGAYALVLTTASGSMMMPLTPHASLPGAYWWGGMTGAPAGMRPVSGEALPVRATTVECEALLSELDPARPWCPVRQWQLPCGRIVALAQSMRAMSAGQFGEYGTYVFTDTGLWVLPRVGGTPVMVTADTCLGAEAVAAVDSGIAYAGARGVHMVAGSKSEIISGDLSGTCSMDMSRLPHIGRLVGIAGASLPHALGETLAGCTLAYDKYRSRLLAVVGDVTYVYSLQSGKWGMCRTQARRQLSARYASGSDGEVYDFESRCADSAELAVVTRPMLRGGKPLGRVRAIGRLDRSAGAICVYGSYDLRDWQVVASAAGTDTGALTGTGYDYYVVAYAATIHRPEHLTHIALDQ